MYRRSALALSVLGLSVALALSACEGAKHDATPAVSEAPVSQPPANPAPTGTPVGTATVSVTGGSGPVTIRYRINGQPEQTDADVTTPWTKDYPVYPKVETTVAVQGQAMCTITLKAMVVSFQPGPNPKCSYAHYE